MKCGKALSEKIKSDRFIDIKRPLKFHKVINLSQNIAQLSITAKTVRKLLTLIEASRIQLFIQKKFTILERLCQSITAVF